jgi:hypothetical protein
MADGLFDPYLRKDSWFDIESNHEGWWDRDLLDGSAASSTRTASVSFAEFEVPFTLDNAKVSFAEFQIPDKPADLAKVSFAELEVPPTPDNAKVSFSEFEVPSQLPRVASISFAEFQVPYAIHMVHLRAKAFQKRAMVSHAELQVP